MSSTTKSLLSQVVKVTVRKSGGNKGKKKTPPQTPQPPRETSPRVKAPQKKADKPPKKKTPRKKTSPPESDEEEALKARGKRGRGRSTVADGDRPASKKRRTSDDDSDVQDIDEEMSNPAYLDSLVKLDARASEESRRKNRYSKLYQASRIIGRYTFQVDPSHCLAFAVVTYGTEQDDRPWGNTRGAHEDDCFELCYKAYDNFLPGIDDAIPVLKANPELIMKLGRYIEKVTGKTRSDDIVCLKPRIIQILGIPDPTYMLVEKSNRGFRHPT
ncbi:hypothetical protein OH76DRAFT_1483186 [Lentinus brumalis]|uniref:Uncharacterized protein n=1 Tax=Lentinus brumalis TaxID=2498619 RepID=A0A371D9K6_9APHY|nr:hypothetical protein OH76DRAFT_1483186 [Polyporus brumalis]